jgi:hypothetical protein
LLLSTSRMIPAKVQVLLPLDQPVTEMEHVLHLGTLLCSHFHVACKQCNSLRNCIAAVSSK